MLLPSTNAVNPLICSLGSPWRGQNMSDLNICIQSVIYVLVHSPGKWKTSLGPRASEFRVLLFDWNVQASSKEGRDFLVFFQHVMLAALKLWVIITLKSFIDLSLRNFSQSEIGNLTFMRKGFPLTIWNISCREDQANK